MRYLCCPYTDTGKPNSTPTGNCITNLCVFPRLCIKTFSVPNGRVRPAEDGKGNYLIFGPGVHWIFNPFMSVAWNNKSLSDEIITHGAIQMLCYFIYARCDTDTMLLYLTVFHCIALHVPASPCIALCRPAPHCPAKRLPQLM